MLTGTIYDQWSLGDHVFAIAMDLWMSMQWIFIIIFSLVMMRLIIGFVPRRIRLPW